MPGESRGTLRAAPCACVELISSPPTPPLSSLPRCCPLSLFHVPECWQRQRRARTPSGLGPAASSRSPTLSSSSLHISLSYSLSLSLFLYPPLYPLISLLPYIARFLLLPLLYLSVHPPFAVSYLFLFTLLRLMYSRCRHLTNKTNSLPLSTPFPLPPSYPFPAVSVFISLYISVRLVPRLASSPLSYLARFSFCPSSSSSSGFLRFTSYIPNTASANKAVFRKPLWILRTFWEIAFPWCGRNCMFRRVDDEKTHG